MVAYTCCFTTDNRFHPLWRVDHDHKRNEAESDSLTLRLMSLSKRFPQTSITQRKRRRTICQTGNSHNNLLSGYKLNQTSWRYQRTQRENQVINGLRYNSQLSQGRR